MGKIRMMELSSCSYNCKAILLAALILTSLCSNGPIGCVARSTGFPGAAARTLPPDVPGEAKLLGYGGAVQGIETAGSSGASLPFFTSPATTPPSSSAGGVGSQRSGDDGRRRPAFKSAVDLKTARRLVGVGETRASSRPSCISNHVPCPPPHV